MKFKIIIIIQGVIAVLFGLSFMIVPVMAMAPFLINEPNADFILLTRMYGSLDLVVGILCFIFIQISETSIKKRIALTFPVWQIMHIVFFTIGISSGVLTKSSNVMNVIMVLLATGFITSAIRKEA